MMMMHTHAIFDLWHGTDGYDDLEAGWFTEEIEPILEEADGY